jgi:lipopolysaccharide export LptBFGC system permease protein LptF
MRACGLHIGHLLLPALAIGLVLTLAIGKFSLDLEAPARAEARVRLRAIAVQTPKIVPGQFHTFQSRVLMADSRDEDGTLHKVFISDYTDPAQPYEVFANRGVILVNEEMAEIQLELSEGSVHLFDKIDTSEDRRISFEKMRYSFQFNNKPEPKGLPWRAHDMSTEILREIMAIPPDVAVPEHLRYIKVKKQHRYAIEYYRRYATAVLPLLFPLLCVPLGLRRHRHSNSSGALICLGIIFCYYTVYGFGASLGDKQILAPLPSIWLASVLLIIISIPLLVRANRSGL